MLVREIIPPDSDELVSLWRTIWAATYDQSLGIQILGRMLAELDVHGVTTMLSGSGERGYCAVLGNSIIASAIINERGNVAYLWGMYIAPAHQRTGIGSALLNTCIASLTSAHTLEVRVLESSPWAISFYRRHGFTVTGWEATELPGGAKTETMVMSRPVQLPLAIPSGVCL